MSGHSKWSQIKRQKAVADSAKGKLFGKFSRAITVAARGNPDPASNLRLRMEIERAREANMPSDSIERAIRRVSDADTASLEEVRVEFIGPGGAAILVRAVTDNHNRTINGLRTIAEQFSGRMVTPGSLTWMFRPGAEVPCTVTDEVTRSRLQEFVHSLREHDDVQEVTTNAQL